jgi:glycosyltransferase involved in cell wall biosynthesis
MGGRTTLFPRAIWRLWRGLVPDADVALEVINGITFLTPLWLRIPRLALVHHVHREHYRDELGLLGRVAAYLLETMPLRRLYRGARFVTVSRASAADIAAHGIPATQISVSYNGVDPIPLGHGKRTPEPSIVHLGRLKRYKRIEALLEVLEAIPEATLHIVGEGDHRQAIEAEISSRGLADRVYMHGFVDEATKLEMLRSAWVHVTSSPREG